MRRAVPVIAATAGSLALLANFHTTANPTAAAATSALAGDTSSTPSPSSTTTPSPSTTAPGGSSSTVGRPSTTIPRTTTTTAAAATRVIDGTDVPTRYGDVQVRVTLRGSRIVDVRPVRLPDSHERSVEISQQAEPRLREEALQAQSANIDVISGASYTSIGYARSLQGALDRTG